MFRKVTIFVSIIAISVALTIAAEAQTGKDLLPSKGRAAQMLQDVRDGKTKTDPLIAAEIRAAFADKGPTTEGLVYGSLVGTWNCTVPTPDGDFYALQTFNADGTFTETSSLLGTLPEGPAHGVWEYRYGGAVLTFELFAFNPDGSVAGRYRVRAFLRLTNRNTLAALTALDFIDLDGTVTEDLANGPYSATRMQVRGL